MKATSGPERQNAAPGNHPIPSDVARKAVQWLIELQNSDETTAIRERWTQWRTAHPDHERAWQQIERVNGRLHDMSSPVKSVIAHATLTPPDSGARRQAIKALASLIFIGGSAWIAKDRTPWRQWTADHRTATGERRTVNLADGSQLVLNTASAVTILFTDHERRVRLVAGEILITTARDPQASARPFLVETAQGRARALGTRYTVRQRTETTDISVFEGAVEIRPADSPQQSLVLQAGSQASFSSLAADTPRQANESSMAWTDGLIVARSMPLKDFLDDLNRYSADTLTCDPAVENLRVSGSYPLNDIPKILDALSATFELETQAVTRFWGERVVRVRPAAQRKNG